MPRKSSGKDLILFSSADPRPLVEWLCDTYGLQTILQAVAQYRPTAAAAEPPAKRAYKKRGAKKAASKKGSKGAAKKSAGKQRGGKGRKGASTSAGGTEMGN